jgi:hypothetical protein
MTKRNIQSSDLPSSVVNAGYALQTVIFPSGDTTGVTDVAAINTALGGNKTVVLRRTSTSTTPFYINMPMVMYSGDTMIFWDAHVKLATNANCNMITNYNATLTSGNQNYGSTADSGLRVIGWGNSWLDGNPTNQAAAFTTGNTTTQAGIQWVNAADIVIQDLKIGPFIWMAGVQIGCEQVRWSRINVNQDRSVSHQDGIDIGPGCSDILIEHTRGMTSDDCYSIWAKYGPTTGAANVTPWTTAAYTASPTNLNTSDVRIIGSKMAVGINFLRCQAGDGATLSGVHAANLVNTDTTLYSSASCLLQLGALNYVTTAPNSNQLIDIVIDGANGIFQYLLGADSNFDDVKLVNVQMTGAFKALIGHFAATGTTANRIDIDVVTTDGGGANNYGIQSIAGDTWDQIRFKAKMSSSKGVLANAGTVTNLDADVFVNNLTGAPFQSSAEETGALRLSIGGRPSTIFSSQSALKMRDVPYLTAADTIPLPTLDSQIVCRSDVDPTNSGYAYGAKYIGDGFNWQRLIQLPGLMAGLTFIKAGGNEVNGTGTTAAITVPSGGHAVGNDLIVVVSTQGSSVVSSVADSKSNTYTVDTTEVDGTTVSISVIRSRLTTALVSGNTINLTLSATSSSIITDSAEFSGLKASTSQLDQTAVSTGASAVTSLAVGPTSTTTETSELAIVAYAISGSTGGSTLGSPFTKLNDLTGTAGTVRALVWGYNILNATAAVSSSATITTAHGYAAAITTYKTS